MAIRANISSADEIKQLLLADVVLIIGFSLALSGGILNAGTPTFRADFVLALPIVAVGVTLSFILHELMHKFVAQRYGAIAGFRSSVSGLLITLVTGAFGFLVGIPGATVIFVQSFTKRENGIVSLAGPLTNFAVFGVALIILFALHPATSSYLNIALNFILFISILLAFFNMLPMYPLDGSKVLAWNPPLYIITMGVIFVLMYVFTTIPLVSLLYMIAIALVISVLYRGVVF